MRKRETKVLDRTYYDQAGLEIEEGDLLQIYHYKHYWRRRKVYMYHVAMLIDGYWHARDYNRLDGKCHYKLRAVADAETGIIKGYWIIKKPNWETEEKLRAEARKRMQENAPLPTLK